MHLFNFPTFVHWYFLSSSFLLALVEHIRGVFTTATIQTESDYCKREGGEILTQVYPNFPILNERAIYTRNSKLQEQKRQKDSCQKDFPTHSNLTPGLYLMTCGCKFKTVYGFSMMLSGESPEMLFDLIMTRFENNYNPHIIYDASCLTKEYGYNRELRRFMSINITTDRFHEKNHTRCSAAFKSSAYSTLANVNSEACEQTNSNLRRVSSSTTFMSPSMFMRSLILFFAEFNISSNRKK